MTKTRAKLSWEGGDVAPLPKISRPTRDKEEKHKSCKCAHRKLSHPRGAVGKVESDLSPFTAEYQPKRTCSTQNKAKRANKIVFLLLVRDQEVEGSNPFAPTT